MEAAVEQACCLCAYQYLQVVAECVQYLLAI